MRTCKRFFVNTCGAVLALSAGILSAFASAQSLPILNADFEQTDSKGWVEHWTTGQHAGQIAYRFAQDKEFVHFGKASARIEQIAPQVFGTFSQRIDVRALAGKRVRLSAMVRAKNIGDGSGGLFARVDGASDTILAHDFTSGATKGTHDWKNATLVIAIPAGAQFLEFGAMLQDFGTLWLDALSAAVTADGVTKNAVAAAPTNALSFEPSTLGVAQPVPNERVKK
jgi:hypothetical protein